MLSLLALIAIAVACLIGWRYVLQRREEHLRDNPPPRRVIEVSLPSGVMNSPPDMARFYRKVASAALGDEKARRAGRRQIDFVYLVDVQAPGGTPRLRCRIEADPDKMDMVKKALKSVYKDQVDVVEVETSELREAALLLRPPKQNERSSEKDARAGGGEELTAGPNDGEDRQ